MKRPEINVVRKTGGEVTSLDVIKRYKDIAKTKKDVTLAEIYESLGFEYDDESREKLNEISFRTSPKNIGGYELGKLKKGEFRTESD